MTPMSFRQPYRSQASPGHGLRALLVALAVALGGLAPLASPATAATYEIAQCRPGEAPIGITPGFVVGIRTAILNDCGAAGVGFNLGNVSNQVSPEGSPWEQAGFELVVPAALPNTTIVRFSAVLSLAAKTESGPGGGGALSTYSAESVRWGSERFISSFAEPAASMFPWDRSDPAGTRALRTVLECGTPCQFSSRPALVMHRATITLDDPIRPAAPTVEPIGLFEGTVQRGSRAVRLATSDADSGVRSLELRTAGGTAVLDRLVDETGCTYTRPAPCPQALSDLETIVDTTKLPDGPQSLEAWTTDAAGNVRKTVLPTITVDNRVPAAPTPTPTPTPAAPTPGPTPPPLNGSGGDARSGGFVAKATPRRVNSAFGKTVKVGGTLVDASGRPVVGAGIDVIERVALAGAPAKTVTTVVTDAAGAFSYSAKALGNRSLTFAFAQRVGSVSYASTVVTELRVKAALSLKASRASARRGVVVTYAGRVQIEGIPKRGARVVLEANSGAGWKLGAIVRTDRAGAFAWSHAFSNRGRYHVRARLLVSADVPARPGISPERRLRVR